jgi:hypothetical protein
MWIVGDPPPVGILHLRYFCRAIEAFSALLAAQAIAPALATLHTAGRIPAAALVALSYRFVGGHVGVEAVLRRARGWWGGGRAGLIAHVLEVTW